LVLCGVFAANPVIWVGGFFYRSYTGESRVKMSVKIYVGNLSKSTTEAEINTLFAQAGEVNSVEVVKDRNSGESKGFAFITMGAQSDADKAISMFNAYSLGGKELKVNVAKPKATI
jgi:RNA recognition motif-containing protein